MNNDFESGEGGYLFHEDEEDELGSLSSSSENEGDFLNLDDDERGIRVFPLLQNELTKALHSRRFQEAIEIINDPNFVVGPWTVRSLNLVLTGPFSRGEVPRNLKIAKLLVEKGANPNLPLMEDDLEPELYIWESPFELLVKFYLSLLAAFGPLEEGSQETPRIYSYSHAELLDTIGLYEPQDGSKITSVNLIAQTKELIAFFFEHGADPNSQIYGNGQTIFHLLLNADVTDMDLVQNMVSKGALVNLTDVHGHTPLMDTIKCQDVNRTIQSYKLLTQINQRLLLDAQNCSGESALWRAMFYGRVDIAELFLLEGASSYTSSRIHCFRPGTRIMMELPALWAPFMYNSMCTNSMNDASQIKLFDVNTFLKKQFNDVSPLVDKGWFCNHENEESIKELICELTKFGHLTQSTSIDLEDGNAREYRIFQDLAIIQLMFGNMSLKMKSIRAILYNTLFKSNPKSVINYIECLKYKPSIEKSSVRGGGAKLKYIRKSTSTPLNLSDAVDDSLLNDQDYVEKLSFSEPEFVDTSVDRIIRIGDNWLLTEDPKYINNSLLQTEENQELEISVEESEEHKRTVVRIHQMLQETDDMLERLQSEVDTVSIDDRVETLDRECARVVSDLDRMTENLTEINNQAMGEPPTSNVHSTSSSESGLNFRFIPSSQSSSPDAFSGYSEESSETSSIHSFGSNYINKNVFNPKELSHECIIQMMTPRILNQILDSLKIPEALRPYFELEMAKYQIGIAIYRHKSLECDRGCEGMEDEEEEDEEEFSEDTDPGLSPASSWETLLEISLSSGDRETDDISSISTESSSSSSSSSRSSRSSPSISSNAAIRDEIGFNWPLDSWTTSSMRVELEHSTDSESD